MADNTPPNTEPGLWEGPIGRGEGLETDGLLGQILAAGELSEMFD